MATVFIFLFLFYSAVETKKSNETDEVIYVACYSPCSVFLDDRLVLYYKMQSSFDLVIPGKINITEDFETLVILLETTDEQYGFIIKSLPVGYYNSLEPNWRCMSLPTQYPGQVINIEELTHMHDDERFIYVNTLVDATEFTKSTFLDLNDELTNAWGRPEDCLKTTDSYGRVWNMTQPVTWLSTDCAKKHVSKHEDKTKKRHKSGNYSRIHVPTKTLMKQLLCTCLNTVTRNPPRFLAYFESLALVLSIVLVIVLLTYTFWKNFFFSVMTFEAQEPLIVESSEDLDSFHYGKNYDNYADDDYYFQKKQEDFDDEDEEEEREKEKEKEEEKGKSKEKVDKKLDEKKMEEKKIEEKKMEEKEEETSDLKKRIKKPGVETEVKEENLKKEEKEEAEVQTSLWKKLNLSWLQRGAKEEDVQKGVKEAKQKEMKEKKQKEMKEKRQKEKKEEKEQKGAKKEEKGDKKITLPEEVKKENEKKDAKEQKENKGGKEEKGKKGEKDENAQKVIKKVTIHKGEKIEKEEKIEKKSNKGDKTQKEVKAEDSKKKVEQTKKK